MSYSASKIECLRFAGRTGGEGIGCCAIDLFQGFVNDPNGKAAVRLTHGDLGSPLTFDGPDGKRHEAWLGPTNKDIFLSYLRIGTFDTKEQPNRMFLCVLTEDQINYGYGPAWLAILKENGFRFIAKVDNSVYTGPAVGEPGEKVWVESDCSCCEGYWSDEGGEPAHPVYLFGLFRNIGVTRVDDPFQPPEAWVALPEPTKTDLERWKEGETRILTKEEATGEIEQPQEATPEGPW